MMQPGATGVVPAAAEQQHQPLPQHQQHWTMMPPPASGWTQQPQMPQQPLSAAQYQVVQPQYAPAQAQYTQALGQPAPPPASADKVRTLWIGDLLFWMDENYIRSCFAHTGEVLSAKVIRNKQTGQIEGYGFIEFVSRAAAERTLQSYNGSLMPNTDRAFRLNWASFSYGDRRQDDGTDFPIFVGDLAADVTDYVLQETFRSHYPSVKGAKVVTDRTTGRSKGYGFVRFVDESEQLRAMTEMNGMLCSTRPMRIGPASNKKNVGEPFTKGCQGALFV